MKKAIIIGAGPAGLTAAYELLKRTDIQPIILEKSEYIGGISRTIDYKGNRMDMGPHRFFSKSDRVMQWWLNIMPLQEGLKKDTTIQYQNKSRSIISDTSSSPPKDPDKRMLIIQRLTRIYFLRKFFTYPIQLSIDTLKTLGLVRTIKILISFLKAKLFPRPSKTLEDFIINQFGKELYLLFFKDYTEKVWGVPCHEISAEWGAQRIKGVSLAKAITQAVKSLRKGKLKDLSQKSTETSLIEQFLYPKYGPGSLWEEVARQVKEMGGKIYMHQQVQDIYTVDDEVCSIHTLDTITGEMRLFEGDYFFSSMPVQELIAGMGDKVPANVQEVAAGLQYRDFINVGILLKGFSTPKDGTYEKLELKDNWIYIQERDVKVGRLMIYNNWGGGMIKDPDTVWLGMEYFCNKSDDFWSLDDTTIQGRAIQELEKMALARPEDVLDITVQRMEKTYPAYFGTYARFAEIKDFVDKYNNLFLIGRNGMHKYNNADHSMLTAMVAVDNIFAGVLSKENIWSINTEQEYHEEKQAEDPTPIASRQRNPLPSLIEYIWGKPWGRTYCLTALVVFIIQFILFKLKYPFANYMPDSYYYLEAAYNNADVNIWPVAYSKFLRLISVFIHSDKFLIGFQYFFLQASTFVFLKTAVYFLQPGKAVRNTLFVFFLFSPIPLFISNYISADALFTGCSLLWASTLIWILYAPQRWQWFIHAVLLLACFTLRYNAIYYPFISVLVFILSRQSWKRKLAGVGLGLLLVCFSFVYTSQKMLQVTGTQQFSGFGGWQLANNALYMYEHIPAAERKPVPTRFAKLEKMVQQHMDTLQKVKLTKEDSINSYFYLWSGRAPLVQYMTSEWKKDSTTPYFKRWASEAPLYLDYATFLIREYPWAYLKVFVLPNVVKFAAPPAEFMGIYNMGGDSVGQLAKDWFQYKSQKVKDHKAKNDQTAFTGWYSIFSALVNVLFIITMLGVLFVGRWKDLPIGFSKVIKFLCFIWLPNLGFSTLSSPIVLRYQLFPVLVCFSLTIILFESFYKRLLEKEKILKTAKV